MGKGDLAKECNIVHVDKRWKDYVKKEGSITKTWNYRWGFLARQYQEMTTSSPTTQSSSEPLKLPKLKAPPQDSSKPFPLVTSGEIGWRSGKMEIYGRESRPRFSIVNQLRWPNDAVP